MVPESLETELRNGNVVPFVGAGVSMGITGLNGEPLFPNWKQLLLTAADVLVNEHDSVGADLVRSQTNAGNLTAAAKEARERLGGAIWYDFLKRIFDKRISDAELGSLLLSKLLWGLGSRLIITTNYDRSLQWACPDKSDFRAWDIQARQEQTQLLREGTAERPTVWHLHGHIDNSDKLILTPDKYEELYQKETYNAALATLHDILKAKSLLFVGFSMNDTDIVEQLLSNDQISGGAASRHYLLVHETEKEKIEAKNIPVRLVTFDDYAKLPAMIGYMCSLSRENDAIYVPESKYVVDASSGIHLFGGRGEAYFQIYDEAILRASSKMDIFSLKLTRFLERQQENLKKLASEIPIRIALLDPSFPFPEDGYSIASLREKEEKADKGTIRRSIFHWWEFMNENRELLHKSNNQNAAGLHLKLYNTLPTVNLFTVDSDCFVGPYLLDIEDKQTPTFLVQRGQDRTSLGADLYAVYEQHFESIWSSSESRYLMDVDDEEIDAWRQGLNV